MYFPISWIVENKKHVSKNKVVPYHYSTKDDLNLRLMPRTKPTDDCKNNNKTSGAFLVSKTEQGETAGH
jgi:hypothetical protein